MLSLDVLKKKELISKLSNFSGILETIINLHTTMNTARFNNLLYLWIYGEFNGHVIEDNLFGIYYVDTRSTNL